MTIPVHPEPGAHPRELRWIVAPDLLRFVGRPAAVPDALGRLLADGRLESVVVEPGAVVLRLADGFAWRAEGPAVRRALQDSLARPEAWRPPSDAAGSSDVRLRAVAERVLAGEVGDYVRSHAGSLTLLGVRDDRVLVALGGSCADCPARDWTLTLRVEAAIRRLYPELMGLDVRPRRPGRPTEGASAVPA
nr:NifU family protein [Propionibacterium sp.]